jgi:hypothetical protein
MLEEERLGGKEDVLPPQWPLFRLPMCLARLAKRISRLVSTPTNSLNTHTPTISIVHCRQPMLAYLGAQRHLLRREYLISPASR